MWGKKFQNIQQPQTRKGIQIPYDSVKERAESKCGGEP